MPGIVHAVIPAKSAENRSATAWQLAAVRQGVASVENTHRYSAMPRIPARAVSPSTCAQIERVMERSALIGQHDVVGARNAHDVIAAGDAQQGQQIVHVVLVRLGMVGVADVAAHRQAQQLAAEMIFQPGADDLLAVIQIFGPDEADDRIDQQRRKLAGDRIGPRLAGLRIDAVMGVGGQARCPARFRNTSDCCRHCPAPELPPSPWLRASMARSTPKLRLAASVPAMD